MSDLSEVKNLDNQTQAGEAAPAPEKKKKDEKVKIEATTHSVAGSFTPTVFRFYQAPAEAVDSLFDSASGGVAAFRKLDSVVIRSFEGYAGTFSVFQPDIEKAVSDEKKNPSKPNPGQRDVAALDGDNDTLVVVGSIKFVEMFRKPLLSDGKAYAKHHEDFVEQYLKDEPRLENLMKKYLQNLVNGRVLWRNQHGFNKKSVFSLRKDDGSQAHFYIRNDADPEFNRLVKEVSAIARRPKGFFNLEVALMVELGLDAEVYPSQPFLDKAEKDAIRDEVYARVLSSRKDVHGQDQAVLEAQKIGNALRTVDSWYNGAEGAAEPIAVEVYGAVTRTRTVHRQKNSYYDIIQKEFNKMTPDEADYVMAVLLKGGLLANVKTKAS